MSGNKDVKKSVKIRESLYDAAQLMATEKDLPIAKIIDVCLRMGLELAAKDGLNFAPRAPENLAGDGTKDLIAQSVAMTDRGRMKWLEWYSALTSKEQYALRFMYKPHKAMARKKEIMKGFDNVDEYGDIQDLPPEYEERYKKGFPLEDKKI